jgi:hypothetical protein
MRSPHAFIVQDDPDLNNEQFSIDEPLMLGTAESEASEQRPLAHRRRQGDTA